MSEKELYYSKDEFDGNWCTDSIAELDLEDGETYFVGERQDIKPSELVGTFPGAQVIERMQECLFDEVGEIAEGRLHVTAEAEEELTQMIRNWADKNATLSCYKIVNVEKKTFVADWGEE